MTSVVEDDPSVPSTSHVERFLEDRISRTRNLPFPLVYRGPSSERLENIRSSAQYKETWTLEDIARQRKQLFHARTVGVASAEPTELASGSPFLPKSHPDPNAVGKKGSGRKVGKNQVSGRPFTSRFRGVHRTIPTKRWEAQFRKDGKPTSLGCFDTEESAARAYDKMMLWCHLHKRRNEKPHASKTHVMNFPSSNYEDDVPWLMEISQESLLLQLRKEGRAEAAATRAIEKARIGAVGGGQ